MRKRSRTGKATENIASGPIARDATLNAIDDGKDTMPPPPTTPNKRRKVANTPTKPPPVTPTPSAIGLMTSTNGAVKKWSSGDIDDESPPPTDRPAEPHHTNAMLVTPGGTQVQPSFTDSSETLSKPGVRATTSTKCLLDEAKAHLLQVDPKFKSTIDAHHCHVFSPDGLKEEIDPFRSLVSGIMSQQVSGAAARSIKNKFVALFPEEACRATGFPPPKLVAAQSIPRLREAGLSQRKAEYVQGLAQKFTTGELTIPMLMNGSDEEVMDKLVAVRGLGVWSVEMFMCFGLKRMDVFSLGDLGVQKGLASYMGKDVNKLRNKGGKWKYATEKEMLDVSAPFAPYRSLFMWYLWRIADVNVEAQEKQQQSPQPVKSTS